MPLCICCYLDRFSDRLYESKPKVFLIINFTLTLVFEGNPYRSNLRADTWLQESSCLPPNLSLVSLPQENKNSAQKNNKVKTA